MSFDPSEIPEMMQDHATKIIEQTSDGVQNIAKNVFDWDGDENSLGGIAVGAITGAVFSVRIVMSVIGLPLFMSKL